MKQILSRFRSRCGECHDPIDKGERITWHSKGRVTCEACTPWPADLDGNTAADDIAAQAPDSDPWAIALAWNSAPPQPGASISSRGMQPATTKPAKPAKPAPVPSTTELNRRASRTLELAREAREIDARGRAAKKATEIEARHAAEAEARHNAPDAPRVDWNKIDIELADVIPIGGDNPRDALPTLSPLALGVYELGTLLVNAVDRLSAGDCDALREHLAYDAEHSTSGGRRRIFEILARACG